VIKRKIRLVLSSIKYLHDSRVSCLTHSYTYLVAYMDTSCIQSQNCKSKNSASLTFFRSSIRSESINQGSRRPRLDYYTNTLKCTYFLI